MICYLQCFPISNYLIVPFDNCFICPYAVEYDDSVQSLNGEVSLARPLVRSLTRRLTFFPSTSINILCSSLLAQGQLYNIEPAEIFLFKRRTDMEVLTFTALDAWHSINRSSIASAVTPTKLWLGVAA